MRSIAIVVGLVVPLVLAGCGAEAPSAPVTTVAPSSAVRVPSVKPKLIEVPDVVGENHQLAQDLMQAAGLYNLREKDASGADRLLLVDRNWVVVRQSPPAGRRVPVDEVMTLTSKKIGE
jgi:hypothetical protein